MKHGWKDVQLGVDKGFPRVSNHVVILAWAHVIPTCCAHSYGFIYHVDPIPYNHVTICTCPYACHIHVCPCPWPCTTPLTILCHYCPLPCHAYFHGSMPTTSPGFLPSYSPFARVIPHSSTFVSSSFMSHVLSGRKSLTCDPFSFKFLVFFQVRSSGNGGAMTSPNKSFVVYILYEIFKEYMTMNDVFVYNPLSLL